jgi:DNA-binding FrmR family transcriptional regulator
MVAAKKTTAKVAKVKQNPLDTRMNRLIGQLEGIRRMINGGRKSDDVVQQILAARQALTRIGLVLLREELTKTSGGAAGSANEKKIQKLLEKIFGM